MLKHQASILKLAIYRSFTECQVNNDFGDDDQFYVRCYFKDKQYLIKGSFYSPYVIAVGLGDNGIGFKKMGQSSNFKQLINIIQKG